MIPRRLQREKARIERLSSQIPRNFKGTTDDLDNITNIVRKDFGLLAFLFPTLIKLIARYLFDWAVENRKDSND